MDGCHHARLFTNFHHRKRQGHHLSLWAMMKITDMMRNFHENLVPSARMLRYVSLEYILGVLAYLAILNKAASMFGPECVSHLEFMVFLNHFDARMK